MGQDFHLQAANEAAVGNEEPTILAEAIKASTNKDYIKYKYIELRAQQLKSESLPAEELVGTVELQTSGKAHETDTDSNSTLRNSNLSGMAAAAVFSVVLASIGVYVVRMSGLRDERPSNGKPPTSLVSAEVAAPASPSSATAASTAEQTVAQTLADPRTSVGATLTHSQAEDTVKAFINLHGELCAEIVSVRPLARPNTGEVTCIEYQNGTGRVVYILDLVTGDMQKGG